VNAMTGLAGGVSAVGVAITVAAPQVYDVTAPTAAAPAAAVAVADKPVTASWLSSISVGVPAATAAAASSFTSLPLASNVVAQSSVATVAQPLSANIVSVPSAAAVDIQSVVACTSSVDNRATA